MEQADSFIAVMEKRKMFIRSQLSADYDKQVLENAKAISDVIQFLTKQGLALRVYHWNKVTRREDGNFRASLSFGKIQCRFEFSFAKITTKCAIL